MAAACALSDANLEMTVMDILFWGGGRLVASKRASGHDDEGRRGMHEADEREMKDKKKEGGKGIEIRTLWSRRSRQPSRLV